MDITTKTITTKVHSATVTADAMKAIALAAAKNQIGLTGDAASLIVSAEATLDADGSIQVEIVERVADAAPVGPAEPVSTDSQPAAAPAAAPAFHFPKAA